MASPLSAENSALILIDIQNDFCPGGALAVSGGDEILPIANRLSRLAANCILTQDWHPAGHSSFASSYPHAAPFSTTEMPYGPQTLWPDHCIQGTDGAAFHPQLETANAQTIVRKGFRAEIDSYSAFFENDRTTPTGLGGLLQNRGIERLFFAGLATDYCVAYSALDAAKLGFEVSVIMDATRAIDLDGSLNQAISLFENAKIRQIASDDLT